MACSILTSRLGTTPPDTPGAQTTRQCCYTTLLAGLVLACGLLTVYGCRATVMGPTQPSGYRVTLPEASQTGRLRPLSLLVHVTDAHGTPVDDVPVYFRIPQAWATAAEVTPPMVVTRRGQATAIFRA
ncbi:MAG TPA: hypothetical protein VIH59_06965, partial [Candidatus Tectomicrobia bacterium]